MKHLFIKGNGQDRIVNLKNVSFVVKEMSKLKIIFNLSYSIELEGKSLISDYIYWSYNSVEDLEKDYERIVTSGYFLEGPEEGLKLINLDKVSSLKFDAKNNRVIWNLNNAITHTIKPLSGEQREIKTADFVYWDFEDKNKFVDFKNLFSGDL